MPELDPAEIELGRLIDEAPVARPAGALSRLARAVWVRAARPDAEHQRRVDQALLSRLRRERERSAGLEAQLAVLRSDHQALADEVRGMHGWLSRVDGEVGGMRTWIQGVSDRREEFAGIARSLAADVGGLRESIAAMDRRVPNPFALDPRGEHALERFDAGLGGEVIGFRRSHSADQSTRVYLGFEELFRGSESQIRARQEVYLPLLVERAPVLDVGCGRGEMLELLRDRGVAAAGVDTDLGMVERCREKGLENVEVADGVAHLEGLPAGSLGAVFAAQVIEHLPYPSLLRLLRAARVALAPGGALIVETVNPHAPQALKHFWIDPTHQHPLFPEVVVALCRLTGFEEAFIWYPGGAGDPDRDRLEQLDYAVIALAQ